MRRVQRKEPSACSALSSLSGRRQLSSQGIPTLSDDHPLRRDLVVAPVSPRRALGHACVAPLVSASSASRLAALAI